LRKTFIFWFTINEIADCLHISRGTTEWLLKELYNTFCAHSKEELIKNVFSLGVVTKDDLCFYRKNKEPAALPKWALYKKGKKNK
jgi:hypothetical protein